MFDMIFMADFVIYKNKKIKVMKFKDIDIYKMPEWWQSLTVEVMAQCEKMLGSRHMFEFLKLVGSL